MNHSIYENLLEDCRSNDPSKQVPAILQLKDLGASEAIPTLVNILIISDEGNVRGLAVEALGYLGAKQDITVGPALLKMLDDSDVLVRCETLDALAVLKYSPAIEKAMYLLSDDPDWLVRATAAEAIFDLTEGVVNEAIITKLELAMSDQYEPVRSYAACSIGLLGTPTPELLSKLQMQLLLEKSDGIKAEILAARYRLGVREDFGKLLELLDIADEHLTAVIINILLDLIERKPPVNLVDDSFSLHEVLAKTAHLFPFERDRTDKIIAQIEGIKMAQAR